MAIQDFTGKNIQDTYQRVVQTDGINLRDGTGSLLPIEFDGNHVIISGTLTAQSYIVSESITAVSSGSTVFGNSEDDTHTFKGAITASGNISSSGTITANEYILPFNKLFRALDNTGAEQNIINNFANGAITFGDDDSGTFIDGNVVVISSPSLNTTGHITASGNISSSGKLIGTINGGSFN